MDFHDIKHEGFLFVVSSPSGTGKTTICRMLIQAEENLVPSVSVTTRKMRSKETNGVDYYFITSEQFNRMVDGDEFLEHAEVFGEQYGTPRAHVEEHISQNQDVLFDIDWQGARQLVEKMPGRVVTLFLLPPSMEELRKRLMRRNQDPKDVIDARMAKAAEEISHYDEYDYVLINHDLEETIGKIIFILHAERHKRTRQHALARFADDLLKR